MGETVPVLTEGEEQELAFWSTYASHLCETDKQTYALEYMGILPNQYQHQAQMYSYDLAGKSILEIGGGPVGVSLRCVNGRRKVIEPLEYPDWIWSRYEYFGIEYERIGVEDMREGNWDEVWVLNVLQHVNDLDKAIQNIKKSAKALRIFEWLGVPTDAAHKFTLDRKYLDKAFGVVGNIIKVDQEYTYKCDAYHGCFDLTAQDSVLHKKWGGDLHRAMIHYIKSIKNDSPLIGAEVGVLAGDNTITILENLNIERLYLIDPYTVYDTDIYSQNELNQARRTAIGKLAQYKDKIVWLPFISQRAAQYLGDTSVKLDFAYLDGDHAYQPVLDDIEAFMPLVKEDGVIGGHDFIADIVEETRCIQVKSAVLDYSQKYAVPFFSCDFAYSDWWIDKSQSRSI